MFRIPRKRTALCLGLVFFSWLRDEPILVRLLARVGFCLVPEEGVSIFDSVAPNAFGVEIVSKH
jgi:hypothetical protein